MTALIELSTIEKTYQACLKKAQTDINTRTWKTLPCGIALDTHKAKYGRAFASGQIVVNPAFIGTRAINQLISTINHELAHLIVGIDKNHNKAFKRVEGHLNYGVKVTTAERELVKVNNGYKYNLIGYTQDKIYSLAGAFKRTKKYLDYDPQGKRTMSFRGDKFLRFEYVPYEAPLPEGTLTEVDLF
jgi:predicted SprT family Zn-dependent metalloprotease